MADQKDEAQEIAERLQNALCRHTADHPLNARDCVLCLAAEIRAYGEHQRAEAEQRRSETVAMLDHCIKIAGEAIGTDPSLRSVACVEVLAQHVESLRADAADASEWRHRARTVEARADRYRTLLKQAADRIAGSFPQHEFCDCFACQIREALREEEPRG